MSAPHLSLVRLAHGLERYDGKYEAFEVFADDIEELHALHRGDPLPPALEAHASGRTLVFKVNGKPYHLTISENSGLARLTRGAGADMESNESDFTILARTVGSAIGRASGSKGEGWIQGLILGLLAGRLMDAQPADRTITVRFDPQAQEWRALGGPMSIWMRQQAAAS